MRNKNRILGLLALSAMALVSCMKETEPLLSENASEVEALTRAASGSSIILPAVNSNTNVRIRQVCYTGTARKNSPHAQLRTATMIGVYTSNGQTLNKFLATFDAVSNLQPYPGHGSKNYMYQAFYPSSQASKDGTDVKFVLPATQTPGNGSVDPKADLLLSNQQFSASQRTDPHTVNGFYFSRLTATGVLNLKGLFGVGVSRVEINSTYRPLAGTIRVDKDDNRTFTETSGTLVLNTAGLQKDADDALTVKFSCLPADRDDYITVKVTTSDNKLYTKNFKHQWFKAGEALTLDFHIMDSLLPGSSTEKIASGVEWTTFHGTWQGEIRNVNIIRTRIDAHNRLGVYFSYRDASYPDGYPACGDGEDPRDLDKKCIYLDALAGTNGSMACCQNVRVNGSNRNRRDDQDPWVSCGALTIDGTDIDIVQVANNSGALTLTSPTFACGGPLLVWNGRHYSYTLAWREWHAAAQAAEDDFLSATNPRTAIGISEDGKTVIQVAVDGRWNRSASAERAIGMSADLLGKLMLQLGCYKAMNLDGGGGTAMWVYGKGNARNIVNRVSENRMDDAGNWVWNWNGTRLREAGTAIYVYQE